MRSLYQFSLVSFCAVAVTVFSGAAFATSSIDDALYSRSITPQSYFQTIQDRGQDRSARDEMRSDSAKRRDEMRGNAESSKEMMRDKFQDLPPEKQDELRARRDEIEKELSGLSPEDRAARIKELRAEWSQKHEMGREERSKNFDERWDNASPDDRLEFCASIRKKCYTEGGVVCQTAKLRCSE